MCIRQAGGPIIEGVTLGAGREVWGQTKVAETGISLPVTHAPWLQGIKVDPQCPSGTWMRNLCLSLTDTHTHGLRPSISKVHRSKSYN